MATEGKSGRNYWVWITKPEYYQGLDQLFNEESSSASDDLGWWTCHKDTQAGDLVLVYRTSPKSDVAYLLEAKTDARILEEPAPEGTILESRYEALAARACSEDPQAKALTHKIQALNEEMEALDSELEGALEEPQTPNDETLKEHREKLLAERRAVESQEGDFYDETEGDFETFEEAEAAAQKTFGARWANLDGLLEEFKDRARVESEMFRRYYELCDRFDQCDESLMKGEDDLTVAVYAYAGLPSDTEMRFDPDFAGDYVCDWIPRYKFEAPVSLVRLKSDSFLSKEWNALRASFKGRVFRFRPDVWDYFAKLASPSNPGFTECLETLEASRVSPDIQDEWSIEERLSTDLGALRPRFDLELFVGQDAKAGRQFPCPEARGYIDLLCIDRRSGDFVVVELKARRAGRNVVGQIKSYMGWVKKVLAGPKQKVRGLIISDGYDQKLRYALESIHDVEQMNLEDIWPGK